MSTWMTCSLLNETTPFLSTGCIYCITSKPKPFPVLVMQYIDPVLGKGVVWFTTLDDVHVLLASYIHNIGTANLLYVPPVFWAHSGSHQDNQCVSSAGVLNSRLRDSVPPTHLNYCAYSYITMHVTDHKFNKISETALSS